MLSRLTIICLFSQCSVSATTECTFKPRFEGKRFSVALKHPVVFLAAVDFNKTCDCWSSGSPSGTRFKRLALLAESVMALDVASDYKRNHTYLWSPAGLRASITLSYLRQSGKEIDLHIKESQLPVLQPSACVRVRIPLHGVIPCNLWVRTCLEVASRCSRPVVFAWKTDTFTSQHALNTHRPSRFHHKDSLSSWSSVTWNTGALWSVCPVRPDPSLLWPCDWVMQLDTCGVV